MSMGTVNAAMILLVVAGPFTGVEHANTIAEQDIACVIRCVGPL